MNINNEIMEQKFKAGDRVKVTKAGQNASDFVPRYIAGIYKDDNWKENIYFIDLHKPIELWKGRSVRYQWCYPLVDEDGKYWGYVYEKGLEKVKEDRRLFVITEGSIFNDKPERYLKAEVVLQDLGFEERKDNYAKALDEKFKHPSYLKFGISINLDTKKWIYGTRPFEWISKELNTYHVAVLENETPYRIEEDWDAEVLINILSPEFNFTLEYVTIDESKESEIALAYPLPENIKIEMWRVGFGKDIERVGIAIDDKRILWYSDSTGYIQESPVMKSSIQPNNKLQLVRVEVEDIKAGDIICIGDDHMSHHISQLGYYTIALNSSRYHYVTDKLKGCCTYRDWKYLYRVEKKEVSAYREWEWIVMDFGAVTIAPPRFYIGGDWDGVTGWETKSCDTIIDVSGNSNHGHLMAAYNMKKVEVDPIEELIKSYDGTCIEKGDKVICVREGVMKDNDGSIFAKVGKEYEVEDLANGIFFITDEQGNQHSFDNPLNEENEWFIKKRKIKVGDAVICYNEGNFTGLEEGREYYVFREEITVDSNGKEAICHLAESWSDITRPIYRKDIYKHFVRK